MNPKFERVKQVMEEVYGKFDSTKPWVPCPYSENKSRYLWTDAFGVCNYITMYRESGDTNYLKAAELLIQNVHDVLGKDREGRNRLGNATDAEPTKGGLRIGKVHPEGHPDGDGQYFHYLTKWMFALSRMTLAANDPKYVNWGVALAQAAHPNFVTNRGTSAPRMFWKISIDMTRPMTRSEGNLDPFDGLVTYRLLREVSPNKDVLQAEIADMERMVQNKYQRYSSTDPLDLGEALWLSSWYPEDQWAKQVTSVSLEALEYLWGTGEFHGAEKYRLAFREFGTTLGTQANKAARPKWTQRVEELHSFWNDKIYKRDRDITPIMFCTSLIPGVSERDYAPSREIHQ